MWWPGRGDEAARLKAIADAGAAKQAEEERIRTRCTRTAKVAIRTSETASSRGGNIQRRVNQGRPLIKISIKRRRRGFGAPVKFELNAGSNHGVQQTQRPELELEQKIVDTAVQDCPSWATTWLPVTARIAAANVTDPPSEKGKAAVPLGELMAKAPHPRMKAP